MLFCLSQAASADDKTVSEIMPETIANAISNYKNNQLDLSKQQFQEALNNKHTKDSALLYLGRIAYDQGDAEKASTYLHQAIDLKPNTTDEYYWLARSYTDQARGAGAYKGVSLAKNIKKYAELAVKIDPKSVHSLRLLIDFHLFAPWIIGGSTDTAKENINKLAKISLVDADIKHVELLKRLAKTDDALKAANELMLKHSKSAEALHLAGLTYQENKLFNEALQCFEQALTIPPTTYNTYYLNKVKFRYAETALMSNSKTQAAITILSNLLSSTKNNPKFVRTWPTWTLAKLYLSTGDTVKYIDLRDSLAKNELREDDILSKNIDKFNNVYMKTK